ncbi:MAG: bifunctional aminoglycoside phosphotransferase/ATP-binding protein [Planctomycetaceae bacterium]
MDAALLAEGLQRPEAYPRPPGRVELRRTHASLLFLTDATVYKVKQAVRFPFLDFSSLEKRRHACEEELRLNRRLAPAVYRRCVPVTRGADGLLRFGGTGETVDWAVEMARLADDRMLDRLLDAGAVTARDLDPILDLLAAFHRDAATGPGVDEHGTPEAVRAIVLDNLDVAAAQWPPRMLARLGAYLTAFLAARRPLFERRVAEGRIRDGHGDLHAGNLCLLPEGPVAYDCIEFSRRLRCGDVAADLAFLVMDLQVRGSRPLSSHLVAGYARRAADPELPHLIPFYVIHRACVRATVAFLRDAPADALRFARYAAGATLPPLLLALCGLPGTGKSSVARAVAAPLGALHLSSDLVRKELHGLPPTARGAAIYGAHATARTYEELERRAEAALAAGSPAVVDGTFPEPGMRARLRELAARRGVPFLLLHVESDEAWVRERMRGRAREGADASDADFAVHLLAKERFRPPLGEAGLLAVRGDRDPGETATEVVERLSGEAPVQI